MIAPLLDVLRDEAARQRLIESLEQAAPEGEALDVYLRELAVSMPAAKAAAVTRNCGARRSLNSRFR